MTRYDAKTITREQLAGLIDHTNLQAFATPGDIRTLCQEAVTCGFASVMVHPAYVATCRTLLSGTDMRIGTVVGFPLGQNTLPVKRFEAEEALNNGADEIDYVLNISQLQGEGADYIREEMTAITALCHSRKALCKVILETCYLSPDEIICAAKIAAAVGPDFIKTSTGFGTGGAKTEDIRLMKAHAGPNVAVKASGGVRTWADCAAMIDAGASRIGTSSGVSILRGWDAK